MNRTIDAQVKAAFDEILARAPDIGETPASNVAYAPSDAHPGASRVWFGVAAAVMMVVVAAGGLIMATSRTTNISPSTATPTPLPAPTTTATAVHPVSVPLVSCRPGENAPDIGAMPSSEMTFSVASTQDGSVAVSAELPNGTTIALGCMTADTAAASVANHLSLAVVHPIANGVLVLLAVPTGSTPRTLSWLNFASGLKSDSAPFTLYVGVVSRDTGAIAPTQASASEQQLVGLVNEARTKGTSTVVGLAADILADR
jgi:hypothetical protein